MTLHLCSWIFTFKEIKFMSTNKSVHESYSTN